MPTKPKKKSRKTTKRKPSSKGSTPVDVRDPDFESVEALTQQIDTLIDHEELADHDFDLANAPRYRSEQLTKISVLIPVYNECWTVRRLIERVLDSSNGLEMELIVVDDGSTDGSYEIIAEVMENEDRIKLVRHPRNRGKGAAIRTAIEHITGDVAIIQDADLEYDPGEYAKLLAPVLEGHADVVYGSRFAGQVRRVHLFWHSFGNRVLTLIGNVLNDLNLTDMETCYKVIRTDILRELRLTSKGFTIEPELTARLAQWGARIYEVPVSYRGRTELEGKKTRPIDGLKAIWEMVRCRFFDTRFTRHTGMYVLRSVKRAQNYNRWLVDRVQPYLGNRVAEAGAGIGNMSQMLADREHLLLADHDPIYVATLKDTFQFRDNVRVLKTDLTQPEFEEPWLQDDLDTVFCSNVLEHLGPHQEILNSFYNALTDDGHCIIIVPADPELYNGLDTSLGHHRRYEASELKQLMENAGFEVVHNEQVCRLGSVAWRINGEVLGRRRLTPRQMLTFDRVWPIVKLFDDRLPGKGMSLIMVGKKNPKSESTANA